MKGFYKLANQVLRIKSSHPVVTRIRRETGNGDTEIFEDRQLVDQAIAEYFADIYKRPNHM